MAATEMKDSRTLDDQSDLDCGFLGFFHWKIAHLMKDRMQTVVSKGCSLTHCMIVCHMEDCSSADDGSDRQCL